MKYLFVCQFLPHPNVRHSGGQDVYHYISSLAEHHSVSLVAFVTAQQQDALASMRNLCDEVVPVAYHANALVPRLWRAFWRFLLPKVYGRTVSLRYLRALSDLVSRAQFDAVIVDGPMALYGRLAGAVPRILDAVDLFFIPAFHIYSNERRLPYRMCALYEWLRLQLWELRCARAYDAVLVRSAKDRDILRAYLPFQKVELLSPWFEGLGELSAIAPTRPTGNRVLFMGAMNLQPNIEAVLHFSQEVLPLIRRQVPDVEFYVVGSAPTKPILRLADNEGIFVTGEVESLTPYYEQCAVNVVPLMTGGGIIVKTLNGMAAARPTVATHAGNSGTGAQPGRDLLVTDQTPSAIADAVVKLLVDQELWTQIALQGRQFVSTAYNWQENIRRLGSLLAQMQR